jgi:hypothetical protein
MTTQTKSAAERAAEAWSLATWRANCTVENTWDDPAVAKPREECQPFTFTLVSDHPNVKAQEKFVKGLDRVRKLEAREAKARLKAVA